MTRRQILKTIKDLSKSQGFYGRWLAMLEATKENDPEFYEAYMDILEKQNFKNAVDLVIYLES